MKKLVLLLSLAAFGLLGVSAPLFAQAPAIENELYLITPVSKDVHDPMLKAFAAWAKKKYDVDVKTSAIPKGTPVAYGQILEWKGSPRRTSSGAARPRSLISWRWRGCSSRCRSPKPCGMRSPPPSASPFRCP